MQVSDVITRIRNRYRWTLSRRCGRRLVELRPPTPMISFTFDDFPKSALWEGGNILTRHGVRGTYYVSLGLMNRDLPAGPGFSQEDVRKVLAQGHELGCHTFAHCHAWDTSPSIFEGSIIENQRALGELVPGAVFHSLSYPIAFPRPQTKRRAAKHFSCCRGGGPKYNVGLTDANSLQACFLEKCRDNPTVAKDLIAANSRERGWLIFATHDVCDTPTPFGCNPTFFQEIVRCSVASGAKVLPVAQAWEALNTK